MKQMFCLKTGCTRSWPRDPALEVECPDCHAPVGVKCHRPSGHSAWQSHVHAGRDIAADRAGYYGPCPLGACGLDVPINDRGTSQLSLFDEARP